MQKILYRDDPYVVLWYDVSLQAYRTDRWAGYALAPAGGGAPFLNQLRATYIALRPLPAPAPMPEAAPEAWIWAALAAALVAAGTVVFALLRRRRATPEDA